jgi:hypothetical protein
MAASLAYQGKSKKFHTKHKYENKTLTITRTYSTYQERQEGVLLATREKRCHETYGQPEICPTGIHTQTAFDDSFPYSFLHYLVLFDELFFGP